MRFVLCSSPPSSFNVLFWFARTLQGVFFSEGRQTCSLFFCFFFFLYLPGRRKEMLGGTAVRNLQQSESGSCLWMSGSLSALLDAPEDILHEWCLAVCFPLPGETKMLLCCCSKETRGPFFLSFRLFHWVLCLRNMLFALFFSPVVSFMYFKLDQLLGVLDKLWGWICILFVKTFLFLCPRILNWSLSL